MTCEEFCEQAGAWALGALEADEVAALEAHLRVPGEHHGCLEALADARQIALELTTQLPTERPSPSVWDRIEKDLGPEQAQPMPLPTRRSRAPMAWALAAAASIAAIWFGLAFRQERDSRQAELANAAAARTTAHASLVTAERAAKRADLDRLACLKDIEALRTDSELQKEALALLEDPTTKIISFASQAGDAYRASALWNASTGRAIVLSSGLAQKPGSDFELWIIRGKGAPQPAGFLRTRPDGTAVGEISHALLADGAPDAFAVSIEPAGAPHRPR
jgi:anti-sigma-K factor RskA